MNFSFPDVGKGSSSWRANFICTVCGAPGSRQIIKRRVRSHQEKVGQAVRVTVTHRCARCGVIGLHGVRINGNYLMGVQPRGITCHES